MTKRKSRYARQRSVLTDEQEMYLLIGGPSPFPTEQAAREAWIQNRDELIGYVPYCFGRVIFELDGVDPSEDERVREALQRLDVE
jgi:hypothetical protein